MKNLIIIGSSGHAKVVLEALEAGDAWQVCGFVDDFRAVGETTLEMPVLGAVKDLPELIRTFDVQGLVVAVGHNYYRSKLVDLVESQLPKIEFPSIIHPQASVSPSAKIARGVFIGPFAVVNADSAVAEFAIINTRASLDHDGKMSAYSSIGPGAVLGGTVHIGYRAAIAIGAVVIQRCVVGDDSLVGAGAVVVSNIDALSVNVGVPARKTRSRKPPDNYL